jgi:hypothetical protein
LPGARRFLKSDIESLVLICGLATIFIDALIAAWCEFLMDRSHASSAAVAITLAILPCVLLAARPLSL